MADVEKNQRAAQLAGHAVELVAAGRAEVHHQLCKARHSR